MKNKMILLGMISIILVISIVNATVVWTSKEVKNSYFREMVEIENNDVWITDLFYISIPLNLSKEKISVSLTPPSKELNNNQNISEVNIKLCEYWNGIKSDVSLYNLSLECNGGELSKEYYQDDFHINNFNLIEINSSKLNWSREISKNQSKVIYIYVKYKIKDFLYVIESDKEKTLWIRGIECNYNNPNCLTENVGMYIVFPDFYFIDGGQNYRLFEISKTNKKMFFISKNAKEDVIINFNDYNEEKKGNIFWESCLILIGIGFSIIFSLIQLYLHKNNFWNNFGWFIFAAGCLSIGFGGIYTKYWYVILGFWLIGIGALLYSFTWKKEDNKKLKDLLNGESKIEGFGEKNLNKLKEYFDDVKYGKIN